MLSKERHQTVTGPNVILVNYGPVGEKFSDLPIELADRCEMIGPITPETKKSLATFNDIVVDKVGKPTLNWHATGPAPAHEIIALDVSLSMGSILASPEIQLFFSSTLDTDAAVALIDQDVRVICQASEFDRWSSENELGQSTSLAAPIQELFAQYMQVIVITDAEGLRSLERLNPEIISSPLDETRNAIFVRLSRQ
jgi:hypothetical protein